MKTDIHKKDFALRLVLKERLKGTHLEFVLHFVLTLEENIEKLAILAENRTLQYPLMFWDDGVEGSSFCYFS